MNSIFSPVQFVACLHTNCFHAFSEVLMTLSVASVMKVGQLWDATVSKM